MHDGSEPEPNLLLLRHRDDVYEDALPGPADVLLVEVADSSLAIDRDQKLPRYAAAGTVEVWIGDLQGDGLLVYREPKTWFQNRRSRSIASLQAGTRAGFETICKDGRYTKTELVEGGTLSPLAFPQLVLALDDVLGPRD
ncbi:MAG TPA: Uma2 family endonuclease [Dehalococcoidia bacterium]|nr:Uma2 family endonuclease [Dehalococcoidia bacterium]